MKLLYITYFFAPDLSAGSFRNSVLVKKLRENLKDGDSVDLITTKPNRYNSFTVDAPDEETGEKVKIYRITVPRHKSTFFGQIKTYMHYYRNVLKLVRNKDYDIVFVSSARLMSGFLGARIASKRKIPFFLDLRDTFYENLKEVVKNPFIKLPVLPLVRWIERYTVGKAGKLTITSPGHKEYFSYYKNDITVINNGIAEVFLENDYKNDNENNIVTYAGNIGDGQALDKIIPELAKKLTEFEFRVYGDGSSKYLLEEKIAEYKLKNVKLFAPVRQNEIPVIYKQTKYILIHLNTYKAFGYLIPSKVYEAGATGKILLAGMQNYPAKFVKENLPDSIVFEPCDHIDAVDKIINYEAPKNDRSEFIKKYRLETLMDKMAKSIIDFYNKSR